MPFCRRIQPEAGKPGASESSPSGHGRNPAAAFRGGEQVAVSHFTFHSGDTCPECSAEEVTARISRLTLVRFVGHAPLEASLFAMERLRLQRLRGRSLPPPNRRRRVRQSTTRRGSGA